MKSMISSSSYAKTVINTARSNSSLQVSKENITVRIISILKWVLL